MLAFFFCNVNVAGLDEQAQIKRSIPEVDIEIELQANCFLLFLASTTVE